MLRWRWLVFCHLHFQIEYSYWPEAFMERKRRPFPLHVFPRQLLLQQSILDEHGALLLPQTPFESGVKVGELVRDCHKLLNKGGATDAPGFIPMASSSAIVAISYYSYLVLSRMWRFRRKFLTAVNLVAVNIPC